MRRHTVHESDTLEYEEVLETMTSGHLQRNGICGGIGNEVLETVDPPYSAQCEIRRFSCVQREKEKERERGEGERRERERDKRDKKRREREREMIEREKKRE
jgi:hypothetical protein